MAKNRRNPAIITKADYECYVVYELKRGYGHHRYNDLVHTACEDLGIRHGRAIKMHRTEYNKITENGSYSSVKYAGTMSLKNFVSHIERVGYDSVEDTMGILCDEGHLFAISFSTMSCNEYRHQYTEEELRKVFRKDYERGILDYQWIDDRNAYVNVRVPLDRLNEAVSSITGKTWDELSKKEQARFDGQFSRLCDAYERLYDFLKRRNNDFMAEMPSDDELTVDFRQMCLDFKD